MFSFEYKHVVHGDGVLASDMASSCQVILANQSQSEQHTERESVVVLDGARWRKNM